MSLRVNMMQQHSWEWFTVSRVTTIAQPSSEGVAGDSPGDVGLHVQLGVLPSQQAGHVDQQAVEQLHNTHTRHRVMSVTLDTTHTHTSQGDVCHFRHNTHTHVTG